MNESWHPRLAACIPASFSALLYTLLVLSLALLLPSCSSEDGEDGVVLSFKLDSAKLGKTDSLRFEIYNGHVPGPGDTTPPVQVVTVKTPAGGVVKVTLSEKVQSDFSMVVIGFDSTGAAQRKVYEFDDFQPDKDTPPILALASIAVADMDMQPGETRVPTIGLKPAEAADKRVVIASQDTSVVRIVAGDKDSVKAVGEGSAVVTVTALVGGAQGRFTVTVKAANRVKTIESKALSGLVGDTLDPELAFDPEDARDKSVSLRSLDSTIAAIAGLRVVGRAEGKTKVEVTALDGGAKDTFEVTVSKVAIRVKGVQGKGIRGLVGDTVAPDLEWDPSDATDKGYTLRSLDTAVARVAGQELAARKLGTARIEVTAADGGSKDTFDLSVVRAGFSKDVLPITSLKCSPCHIPGLALNFQDSVLLLRKGVGALDRLQRDSLAIGKMPLRGAPNGDLTVRQLGVLLDWLNHYVVPLANMTAKDMTMNLGDTAAPNLVWTPDSASNRTFTLTSIDSSVVSVTADNLLVPLKAGQTTILAQSDEGAHKVQFKVTVDPPSFAKNVLPITSFKCSPCHVPGQTFNFQDSSLLVLEGAQALDRLQRDSLAAGKMPLRGAPNGDLSPLEKSILLAWLKSKVVPLKGIEVANDSVLVDHGKAPSITYDPPNASNKSYSLTSLDTAVIGIDGGMFVGKAVGSAQVEVRALDGNYLKLMTVKVKPVPVDSVRAVDTSMAIGDTVVPRVEFFPANAAVKTFVLTLPNASTIVSLAPGPKIVGLAVGKDTVVVASTDGGKKDSLVVVVGPVLPKGLTVRDTNNVIGVLVTPTLVWNPANTTNKTVTYAIAAADTAIAAVRGTQILGKAVGAVTVTARSSADTSLKDTFVFTVGPVPVIGISAPAVATNHYCSTVVSGRTYVTFNPSNATNKGFVLSLVPATDKISILSDTTFRVLKLGAASVRLTSKDGAKTANWNMNILRPPFTGAVKNMFSAKCIECHSKEVWEERDWQDSIKVVAFRTTIITRISAVDATRMPPTSRTALTQAEIKVLRDWLQIE